MKNVLSIHIPEPCHEDWQQMTPVDKGRFCQSCAKQVVDFSMMTDQEILRFISKASGGLCGRFADDQLQRPLQPIKQEKKKVWWLAVAMPLLALFEKTNAQKTVTAPKPAEHIIRLEQLVGLMGDFIITKRHKRFKPVKEKIILKQEAGNFDTAITVIRKKGDANFTILGEITDKKDNTPIPYATILVKGSKIASLADERGNFKITGNTAEKHVVLQVSAVGFGIVEMPVSFTDSEAVQKELGYAIKGRVIDAEAGNSLPFVSVAIKHLGQGTATDDHGNFLLQLDIKNTNVALVISGVGYKDREVPLTLNDSAAAINVDTIKLIPTHASLNDIVVFAGAVTCYRKPSVKDTVPTLIRRIFHSEKFRVSPNPVPRGGNINIDVKEEGSYSIQLFDNSGKMIQYKAFEAVKGITKTSLGIPSSLAAGMYYIRLVDEKNKKQYTDKIMVQ